MLQTYNARKNRIIYVIIMYSGFFLIALPLYASNSILDYIKLFNTDLNIFHILFGIEACFFIIVGRYGRSISKHWLWVYLYMLIIIYQTFVGFVNKEATTYILRDANMYLLPILILIVFYNYFIRIDCNLEDLMNYFLNAVTVCCTINLFMYLTRSWLFWGVQTFAGNRFGGSYLTAILFVTWYATYLFLNRKKGKWFIIYFYFVSTISLILAQSRASLISATLLIPFIILIDAREKNSINKRKFMTLLIISIVGSITVFLFVKGDSDIAQRLQGFGEITSDVSFLVRLKVYGENLKILLTNPMGLGLGALLPIYDSQGAVFGYSNFIDNVLLTIGEKLGIIALFSYIIVLIIRPLKQLKRKYKMDWDNLHLLCSIGYCVFLINIMILTAQSITSLSASTIIWIFTAYLMAQYKKERIR